MAIKPITNPRKNYNFKAIISAQYYNPFMVQELKTPDVDIDVVEHGQANSTIKTAGQIKYTNAQLKGIIPQEQGLDWVQVWIKDVQDILRGGGLVPNMYKKNLQVVYLGIDGKTVVETETWEGAWPCKLNGKDLKAIGSENIINDLELCVDKVINSAAR